MTPKQRRKKLELMRSMLQYCQSKQAAHQNAAIEIEADIYRLEGDIERLENEGGEDD